MQGTVATLGTERILNMNTQEDRSTLETQKEMSILPTNRQLDLLDYGSPGRSCVA
jgi:hypothetical protein